QPDATVGKGDDAREITLGNHLHGALGVSAADVHDRAEPGEDRAFRFCDRTQRVVDDPGEVAVVADPPAHLQSEGRVRVVENAYLRPFTRGGRVTRAQFAVLLHALISRPPRRGRVVRTFTPLQATRQYVYE